jgi:hypothetical protein
VGQDIGDVPAIDVEHPFDGALPERLVELNTEDVSHGGRILPMFTVYQVDRPDVRPFRSFPSQENLPENANQKRSSLKGSDPTQADCRIFIQE